MKDGFFCFSIDPLHGSFFVSYVPICREMEAGVWDAEEEMFQEGQNFVEPQRTKKP
jgi:hypothetical protein